MFGRGRRAWQQAAVILCCAVVAWTPARAGGPRFVTGTTFWNGAGNAIAFYTSSPAYYTDPGNLSATVTHAQADAMVAAAAAPWNVSTSVLVLKQGGQLAEHVSSANVYFDGSEMVFPADASATNYLNIPIAVIYDSDGSVIDTLLGAGASDPSGCRQTGVVESVDSIGLEGAIHHAMLILNGRCVGSGAQQLTQMQYQLERAFGRVLGVSWSQLNDNVFTGATPMVTGEMNYWPVMHPIDVLCGPYSYQCMTNPFQLRMDDVSTLALLYPVTPSNIAASETLSSANALGINGGVYFPTGQGMDWVNVAVTRRYGNNPEPWQVVSGITGVAFQQNGGNPVTGSESDLENIGMAWGGAEGNYLVLRVEDAGHVTAYMNSEPINPLYTGEYAIGPYQRPPVTPSGSSVGTYWWDAPAGLSFGFLGTAWDAASSCSPGADGTQSAPVAADASGWWTGLLCPVGHSSWRSLQVNAGSSWTLEVTAEDETGAATLNKAQPVLGVWNAGDGGLPTVASQPFSMNTLAPGVTQLQMPAGSSRRNYTVAVADQYGAGRPDFAYKARVMYAASVSPATVGSTGGQIVITGEGFRQGNQVSVNGAVATVLSWSSNQIVARAPSVSAAGALLGVPVDVMVTDIGTGGQTDIYPAFSYVTAVPGEAVLVSAPALLETGMTAATPFAVRLVQIDGVTPLAGDAVQVTVLSGSAGLTACGGATTCVLTTDATGLISTGVTGRGVGPVVLNATEVNGSAAVQVTVMDNDPVRLVTIANTPIYVAAGASATWTISLSATQDGVAAVGVPIVWTASAGLSLSYSAGLTDGTGAGTVAVSASQLSVGPATVTGCLWGTVCATWTVTAVDPSQWRVGIGDGGAQSVHVGTLLVPVTFSITDTAGHTLQGATVSVYQTADGWEGVCPVPGQCAASPVLRSSQSAAISDSNGSVVVTPLEVPGLPQVVNIAAVTGTQGFVTLSLPVNP